MLCLQWLKKLRVRCANGDDGGGGGGGSSGGGSGGGGHISSTPDMHACSPLQICGLLEDEKREVYDKIWDVRLDTKGGALSSAPRVPPAVFTIDKEAESAIVEFIVILLCFLGCGPSSHHSF
ncbi:hypothetical protein LOAG_02941 [Loa loa]|uniref:Uncharacterized protein n=1 Tax=Loa loa TaxID=7209 RepID=A0A1S0U7H1_LOALO|nr:hypothetical protein LOAG_02941 [Loa loa]EFO25541.1 hypothetical protein LOAG_02941 [Loa loa]